MRRYDPLFCGLLHHPLLIDENVGPTVVALQLTVVTYEGRSSGLQLSLGPCPLLIGFRLSSSADQFL